MNLSTIIVCLIILLLVVCAIITMVRNKKNGRRSCGGNCSSCSMYGSCHKAEKTEK